MAIDITKLSDPQRRDLVAKLQNEPVNAEWGKEEVDNFLGIDENGVWDKENGIDEETVKSALSQKEVEQFFGEGGKSGKIQAKKLKSFKVTPFTASAAASGAAVVSPATPAAASQAKPKGKGKDKPVSKPEQAETPSLPKELVAPAEPWAGQTSPAALKVAAGKKLNTGNIGAVVVEQLVDFSDYLPHPDRDKDLVGYIDRPEVMRAFDIFFETKHNLMMIGEAGSGKSTIGKFWAWQKNNISPTKLPYLAISADGLMSVNALFGSHHIVNGTSYYIEGLFTTFTKVPSVILIDEVTALDPSKNFIFHQILAERKFFVKEANETYYLNDNCLLIFAGNPMNPKYPGVGKMNLAFADRMGTLQLEALTIEEIKSLFQADVKSGNITAKQLEQLMDYTKNIREYIARSSSVKAEFSTRSLKRIVSFLSKKVDFREAVEWAFINTYTAFDRTTHDSLMAATNNFFLKGSVT